VVQELFRWVGLEGLSLAAAARRLTAQGVRPRRSHHWDRTTVHKLLTNPAYQGEAAWGKTRRQPCRSGARRRWCGRGKPAREWAPYPTSPQEQEKIAVPALIGEDLFAAVAQRLAQNRQRQRQHTSGPSHLLQGLLICQVCQHAYCGRRLKSPRPYVYYRCLGTDRYRWGGTTLCNNRGLNAQVLDQAIWEDVCALLRNPERLRHELERRLQRPGADALELQQREKTLSQAKRRIM
jgi:site-specific DNA recombinase